MHTEKPNPSTPHYSVLYHPSSSFYINSIYNYEVAMSVRKATLINYVLEYDVE